ncbi:5'-nucleotidase, lipoprotein e(P4) family [Rhizosphaericola mali]|uniref:5'-nucleotidase, lipoprotein e(P4) family n=1 Tax=Rhizosphaericola mali TaxID=2545455 RepID=A0A5P2G861_9BACT|nr:5'-nucleotidase, lipoprotein e(P4) family [Rhizosphaericola mali]QES87711.1 5'-nucleotidase, lipoprotein e(P4) family [Rhizosphaericola mali]
MEWKKILPALSLIGMAACKTAQSDKSHANTQNPYSHGLTLDGKLYGAVWQQRAAEYKALCEQAFNVASDRLMIALKENTDNRPKAVVTDIDETFLDNSPNSVKQTQKGKGYEQKSWEEWTAKAMADTLWGAYQFYNLAKQNDVEVFYITNRGNSERAGTLKNLQKFGFPYADETHLITREGSSSKETRRKTVASKYDILLFCGDNLADFSDMFDKKTEAERSKNVANLHALFGRKFIVLPNVVYGDWEGALFNYNYKYSLPQQDSIYYHAAKSE